MENCSSKRFVYIDYLEAFAIVFVLLYHCTTYSFDFLASASPVSYLRYLFRAVLAVCAPLFFFANGYLLLGREFDLHRHIRKTVRLIILTLLWGAITTLVLMAIRSVRLSVIDFIIKSVGLVNDWTNHLWFLYTLIFIYLLFPLVKAAYDCRKTVFNYFFILVLVLSVLSGAFDMADRLFPDTMVSAVCQICKTFLNNLNPFKGVRYWALAYFFAGGIARDKTGQILSVSARRRNLIASAVLIVSCLCLFAAGVRISVRSGEVWDVVFNGYNTVFTMINVLCVFILCLNFTGESRAVTAVAKNTLGIYLIHLLVFNSILPYVERLPFSGGFAFSALLSVIILFVSLAAAVLIKKIPVLRGLLKY